jgi:RNA polymerase sigma-70 factor (family 1)
VPNIPDHTDPQFESDAGTESSAGGSKSRASDTKSSTSPRSPSNDPATDRNLFRRISEGDESAFQTIFHSYNRTLYPYILSVVKVDADAKEIIQEIFLKLWLKRDTLTSIDNPGGWLYTIASTECLLHLRKEARYARRLQNIANESGASSAGFGPGPNFTDIHEAWDSKEVKALIREAVEKLPLRRRQVFQMSRLEGYSRKEIAEFLGTSENTVRNQLTDAVDFIQDYIRKNKSLYLPALLIGLLAGL